MDHVVIGVDPHKLSATIEVVDGHEKPLGTGRFTTDRAGYAAMRTYVRSWPDRVWAVEGANGAGRPLAQRLLESGEHVVDVPAKLAARVRLFDTGHNRKTDALDAHSIAIVAVRTTTLRVLRADGELEALRMLTDRREALTRRRVQTVNRLQALLAELLPGQAKKDITALQAKAMLARVRPRDIAGKTRRRIAAEELAELIAIDSTMKKATAELKTMVLARDSRLMNIHGVGPVVAARVLADVGDIARFADRNRFASWTGTAPLDASSGEQNRHRLSRAGNRRMNHMIHIAAVTQISQRVRAVGDVFTMILTGGKVRENHVVEFDEGLRIAWRPAEPGQEPPGHLWRWELEPIDSSRTRIIHTYDWTQLTDESRISRARATTADKLQNSLDRLAALAEGR